MVDLKSFPELIKQAKEMALKRFYNLKKAQLIELIENPPSSNTKPRAKIYCW